MTQKPTPRIGRRNALCCCAALASGLFSSLNLPAAQAAAEANNGEGTASWRNPCRGALPADLARHDIVLSAFAGIDPTQLLDVHAHLLGTGDSGSGCSIHPSMNQWWHPVEVLRRKTILNAACTDEAAPSVDKLYVDKLRSLTNDFPPGARWWLYAFDHACDNAGREHKDWSTFQVPDVYAHRMAAQHAAQFDWVASIHPYREDALQRLSLAIEGKARAVKWLPSAMNINPADARCNRFYDALAKAQMPLVVHGGEEKAVPGAGRDAYGNPLLLRGALARGVRVIVAHAASLGVAIDIDKTSQPEAQAFDLFARLMDEPGNAPLLMADISAVFARTRRPEVWRKLLSSPAWHPRLLHGSDYPLPGVLPLYVPQKLADAGVLDSQDVGPLLRLREYNALLFDFVLKRRLRLGAGATAQRLPASIFEGHALRAASSAPARAPSPTRPT